MNYEVTFASFKAPYHANALAQKYGHHFFSLPKLDKLVKAKKIRKSKSLLFLVGGYTRANGYRPQDIVPLYNRLADGYKKTIVTFAGSDIIQINNFTPRYKRDFIKFLKRPDVTVTAVGDYMAEEVLETIGIEAKILYMPMNHDFSGIPAPLPEKFTVGCYMPRSGNEFYGYDVIIGAVKQLPDIDFHFYSLLGYSPSKQEAKIKNLICHEDPIEINEMEEFLDQMTCGLRVTQHDGNPMSLAEYNAAGRYFLFNKEMPFSDYVMERDAKKISEGLLKIKERATEVNGGVDFYIKRHDKQAFWNNIMKIYRV
jgi:hypothetical protein